MFVIFLRFAENRHLAGEHMDGHNDWIRQGIADAVFLLAGSVSGGQGGAIIAHGLGPDGIGLGAACLKTARLRAYSVRSAALIMRK